MKASRETGTLSHALHRLTGVLLVVYLFMHIGLMTQARFNGETFDDLMKTFKSPPFLLIDLVIFVGVVLHGLNGARITLFDMGIGIRRQKEIFWAVIVVAAIITVWAFAIILPLVLGGG